MRSPAAPPVAFVKMHGLGNDFVIIDARGIAPDLGAAAARAIADRHRGVGCDQVLILEKPRAAEAAAFMRIFNADGSEAEACGNGARCVADLLMRAENRSEIAIETAVGTLAASRAGAGRVAVDMGEPRWEWQAIPLARDCDTLHLPLSLGPLADAVATSMGNQHATFFVADAEAIDLPRLGPVLERDPIFPARANIGVAQVLGPNRLRLRVWERGDGLTLACGSGACAALVGAARRGLIQRSAELRLDGGALAIEWRADNRVIMTGPVATSFAGTLDPSLLG